MDQGYQVFSPIAHSHPIEIHGMSAIRQADFWLAQDYAILRHCDVLVVLCLEGWDRSHGVANEVRFALQNNIPVYYIGEDMEDIGTAMLFNVPTEDFDAFIETEEPESYDAFIQTLGELSPGETINLPDRK